MYLSISSAHVSWHKVEGSDSDMGKKEREDAMGSSKHLEGHPGFLTMLAHFSKFPTY